jgi:hypothetical protein
MTTLNFVKDNLGTSSFSSVPTYLIVEPNANYGVAPIMVVTDPVNPLVQKESLNNLKRRFRRNLMSDLTNEFMTWNDELLRELAR